MLIFRYAAMLRHYAAARRASPLIRVAAPYQRDAAALLRDSAYVMPLLPGAIGQRHSLILCRFFRRRVIAPCWRLPAIADSLRLPPAMPFRRQRAASPLAGCFAAASFARFHSMSRRHSLFIIDAASFAFTPPLFLLHAFADAAMPTFLFGRHAAASAASHFSHSLMPRR